MTTSSGAHKTLAVIALVLALSAAFAGSSRNASTLANTRALAIEIERGSDHVSALELAQWIKDRKAGLRVIDVRSDSEFQQFHIPSAEEMPLTSLSTLKVDPAQTIVLYSEGGAHAAQGWMLLRAAGHARVFYLRGGVLDWTDDVLNAALPEKPDSASERRAALSRYFGGVPHIGAPTSGDGDAAAVVARVKRRGC